MVNTTRTLSVTRAGAGTPPAAVPAIASELAVLIGALAAIAVVVMVLVKISLAKKP